jgi:ribosomal-protein-alanine N-acetyltransferase
MHSETRAENAENLSSCYFVRLTVDDVPLLRPLEDQVNLSFWGKENYQRFLEEYPEYFGSKAVWMSDDGNKKLAGFVLARSIYENLEILKLGVFPKFQRLGIGSRLMDTAYAEGMQRGCNRCFLEVRKSNQKAIQFYNAHNFQIAGKRLNYYTDPVEDAWVMERAL